MLHCLHVEPVPIWYPGGIIVCTTVLVKRIIPEGILRVKFFFCSFEAGMERTKRYKTDGGDTAWEEKKKQSYATSEVSAKVVYPHATLRLEVSPLQVAHHRNQPELFTIM